MVLRYTATLLLLFLATVSRAQDAPQESIFPTISEAYLDKLIASAKAHYPRIRAMENRVKLAETNIQKAKWDWLSVFTLNYLYSPQSSTVVNGSGAVFLNGYSFGVGASVGSVFQKPIAVKAARADLELAKLNQEEYNLSITSLVKQRYYSYIQLLTALNWKTKNLESADRIVKEAKYKFEKGEETFDAYNTVYASYSNSVVTKLQAETEYLVAKSNLEELIGAKIEDIK